MKAWLRTAVIGVSIFNAGASYGATCIDTPSQVRHLFPGAYPSYTRHLEGHLHRKCWFPSISHHNHHPDERWSNNLSDDLLKELTELRSRNHHREAIREIKKLIKEAKVIPVKETKVIPNPVKTIPVNLEVETAQNEIKTSDDPFEGSYEKPDPATQQAYLNYIKKLRTTKVPDL